MSRGHGGRPSRGGAVAERPASLAERARAVGREERATPFMTLMAAFKALLYAHTGQQDLLVGSPAAMRTHPELEHAVGAVREHARVPDQHGR